MPVRDPRMAAPTDREAPESARPAPKAARQGRTWPDPGHTRLPLGVRFLVIVLVAVAIPLGLTGVWMVRDAGRAGETLLRSRMGGALDELVRETGSRWVALRSAILDLADDPRLQRALLDADQGPAQGTGRPAERDALARSLAEDHPELSGILKEALARRPGGDVVGRIAWDDPPSSGAAGIPATLDVRDPGTGTLLGHLDVRVDADALLSGWEERTARAGGVLGVFDPGSGRPLVSVPFDPELLRSDRFLLGDEEWITSRRPLTQPRAVLVLASPLEPFTIPFREAARRGILLILAVGVGGFAIAALLTVRTTRPLARLADAAEAVSRGDLETRVRPDGPREIARVAAAFNSMAGSLRQTLDALAERESLAAVGEFAATLAHEIRNPLTAMRLDLQRLEEVSDDEDARESLTARILSAARQLDRTVDGVLRVAGAGRARLEPVLLDDVLGRAFRTALPTFEARGVELDPPARDGTPVEVEGDPPALEQLFVNLLINAAEAVPGGGRVTIERHTSGDHVEVVVRDTGPGLPEDVRASALEPLFSTKPGGTGLGLAIADRIVRAHGGRLQLANDPEGGARITVWLHGAGPAASSVP